MPLYICDQEQPMSYFAPFSRSSA